MAERATTSGTKEAQDQGLLTYEVSRTNLGSRSAGRL